MLSIENPHLAGVDMGKNSFLLPKIRRSFEHALQLLSFALSDGAAASYLGFFIRTDDPALHQEDLTDLNEKGALRGCSSDDDSDCVVLGTTFSSGNGNGNSKGNGNGNSNGNGKGKGNGNGNGNGKKPPSKTGSQTSSSTLVAALRAQTPLMDAHALLDIGGDPYDEASTEESTKDEEEDSEEEEEQSEEEEDEEDEGEEEDEDEDEHDEF